MLPNRAQCGEVNGRAEAGAQGRRDGAAPEGGDGIGGPCDLADGGPDGLRARLLDASLEQVDGLEEDGAKGTRAQPGDEVERLL